MKQLYLIFFNIFFIYSINGAIFTVTTVADTGVGSLRNAINSVNVDPDPTHVINFSIGSGVQTIQPLTQFPLITASNTLVDGTTQLGWSIGNPVIVINGSLLPVPGVATGILTLSAVSNCTIQGLVINGGNNSNQQFGILITDNVPTGANNNAVYGCFIGTDVTGTIAVPNHNGIRINAFTPDSSNNNMIGGPLIGQRNLISGNANGGLQLLKNVNNTVIQGNFIGTDKTGTVSLPNLGFGFASFGSLTPLPNEQNIGTIIGGSAPGEGNLISGNVNAGNSVGIVLWFNSIDTVIQGNLIGVDVTGTVALPNDLGIFCFGTTAPSNAPVDNTLIGGPNTGEGNIISGNNFQGIFLQNNIINSIIQGNDIGTDINGTLNLGNGSTGILIQGGLNQPCTNNLIGGTGPGERNIIANNGNATPPDYGVIVDGDPTTPDILNPILGNSIYANNNNGIELQNGGNDLQSPPTILSAEIFVPTNSITISAVAPTTPLGANFRLEFFVNNVDRSPITEGRRFIGAIASVPAGTAVMPTFVVPIPSIIPGSWVSSTATNLNNTGNTPGDTSEFSPNIEIEQMIFSVVLTVTPNIVCPGNPATLTATIIGTPPFDVVWSDGFVQTGVVSPVSHVVNPTFTTAYAVAVTNSMGDTITAGGAIVTVDNVTVTVTSTPGTICKGQFSTLEATIVGIAPFNLIWSDGVVQSGVNSPAFRIVSPTRGTTYFVTATDALGCIGNSNGACVRVNNC